MTNKIDLATYLGANLDMIETDTNHMHPNKPWVFGNLKSGEGHDTIIEFINLEGRLTRA